MRVSAQHPDGTLEALEVLHVSGIRKDSDVDVLVQVPYFRADMVEMLESARKDLKDAQAELEKLRDALPEKEGITCRQRGTLCARGVHLCAQAGRCMLGEAPERDAVREILQGEVNLSHGHVSVRGYDPEGKFTAGVVRTTLTSRDDVRVMTLLLELRDRIKHGTRIDPEGFYRLLVGTTAPKARERCSHFPLGAPNGLACAMCEQERQQRTTEYKS